MKPDYQREGITLYCADCLDVLPHLSGVDAVVTDPPYGIAFSGSNASTRKWDGIRNDSGGLNLRPILGMSIPVIAFGANCYPNQLPHRGRWLCWDKRMPSGSCDSMLGSPFELAWCNKTSGFDRMVRCLHGGVINADSTNGIHAKRMHPTQKPTAVMISAIEWISGMKQTILDPFMGSGTTGIACIRTGRQFIGIEIEPKYFDIAVQRIEAELNQTDLFRTSGESRNP